MYKNSLAAANTTPATTASTRFLLRNSRRTTTSTPTHGLPSQALPCFLRTSSMELLTPLLLWRTGRVSTRRRPCSNRMTLHYLSLCLQSKFRVVIDRHHWRSILEPGHLSSTGSTRGRQS